jgi:hypothetical protein
MKIDLESLQQAVLGGQSDDAARFNLGNPPTPGNIMSKELPEPVRNKRLLDLIQAVNLR